MKLYFGVTALLLSLVPIDRALAGFFQITPAPTPPAAPVPEIDGPGGIAAIALLASVVAIILNRSRNK